jgi:hypothetical protein
MSHGIERSHWWPKQTGGFCILRHIKQYVIYLVVVSFIGGGNQSTWRKPPTCCTKYTSTWTGFELTTPTTIRSRIRRPQTLCQYRSCCKLTFAMSIFISHWKDRNEKIYPTRKGKVVDQELLTLPEHLSSPPIFSGVRVSGSLVLYVCFVDRCLSFVLFLLAIVLSVHLRFTDSDYLFGIFKLF